MTTTTTSSTSTKRKISVVSISADDDQESSRNVDVASSDVAKRGRTKKAVQPGLAARFDDSDGGAASELALMSEFHAIVVSKCVDVYPSGLTAQMVQQYPILEYFVHRVPHGTLIRDDRGGYKRVKQGKFGVDTEFVCHKLVYCHSNRQRYTRCEGDISHDCHHRGCCRREHLSKVTHAENASLSSGGGCGGWLFNTDTGQLICNCTHVRKCTWLRIISNAGCVYDAKTATSSIFAR